MGKPAGQATAPSKWQEQIYFALRLSRLDKVRGLNAHKVPRRWKPGMAVDAEPVMALTSALALDETREGEALPTTLLSGLEVEEESATKKRKRV